MFGIGDVAIGAWMLLINITLVECHAGQCGVPLQEMTIPVQLFATQEECTARKHEQNAATLSLVEIWPRHGLRQQGRWSCLPLPTGTLEEDTSRAE